MKIQSVFNTVASAMDNAKRAIKPAIGDMSSTDNDYELIKLMKLYITLDTMFHRAIKISQPNPHTEAIYE